MPSPPRDLAGLRSGKAALAAALTALETGADETGLYDADVLVLLDAAWNDPRGHVLGLTGPPGVGKSTLTDALLRHFRSAGKSVGILAVDPSSHLTGGALLGDRTRIRTDPDDADTFLRSFAARNRLGGLSDQAFAATVLMCAVFDNVIVETVGIGQSETEIGIVADTVVLCVQPGSGDALQFMKAGIMELPDIVAVTKADTGAPARRAQADVEGALGLSPSSGTWTVPVIMLSAARGEGIDTLVNAADQHRQHLSRADFSARRRQQAATWMTETVRSRYGTNGLGRAISALEAADKNAPFSAVSAILSGLEK